MKPMLASPVKDTSQLHYPVYASPKLDGVRAIVLNGVVLSRSLKPIPSHQVQTLFGRPELNGFDGELIAGDPTAKNVFNVTTSAVMSRDGVANVKFYVFDNILCSPGTPFKERFETTKGTITIPVPVIRLEQRLIHSVSELDQYEIDKLESGFEGVMIRSPKGLYKHGRSTLKEGYLLKLKRFEDSEAIVIGMNKLMHNENMATIDHLGHQVRSSHKANMKGLGIMGSLICRDAKTGVEFEIGTGFSREDREWWWLRGATCSDIVKYKFQPTGVKDKPRFPVYIGIRHKVDLS